MHHTLLRLGFATKDRKHYNCVYLGISVTVDGVTLLEVKSGNDILSKIKTIKDLEHYIYSKGDIL